MESGTSGSESEQPDNFASNERLLIQTGGELHVCEGEGRVLTGAEPFPSGISSSRAQRPISPLVVRGRGTFQHQTL